MAGLDLTTVQGALEGGFAPDTISSDLHRYSVKEARDLPTVLSRFLSLGMALGDVLHRGTAAPAHFLGLLEKGVGHLRVGGVADVAVLRMIQREHRFVDRNGAVLEGSRWLGLERTIQGGELVFSAPRAATAVGQMMARLAPSVERTAHLSAVGN